MFRFGIAVALISALLVTACGGGGGSSSGSSSAAGGSSGSASTQGKTVFTSNCKSCHTLKDADATGSIGPNLDELQPDKATVQRQVINGGGPMPAFKGKLSTTQINDVSTYVSSVAGQS